MFGGGRGRSQTVVGEHGFDVYAQNHPVLRPRQRQSQTSPEKPDLVEERGDGDAHGVPLGGLHLEVEGANVRLVKLQHHVHVPPAQRKVAELDVVVRGHGSFDLEHGTADLFVEDALVYAAAPLHGRLARIQPRGREQAERVSVRVLHVWPELAQDSRGEAWMSDERVSCAALVEIVFEFVNLPSRVNGAPCASAVRDSYATCECVVPS